MQRKKSELKPYGATTTHKTASMFMSEKPTMSVKEARKLLGKEHANMTDEEVSKLVSDAEVLAEIALKVAQEQRLKDKRPQQDVPI